MLILGLTGQSGAGKGYVASLFAKQGIPSIDCDAVSRAVCAPGAPCTLALAQAFGTDILDADGALLRRKLANRAFADPTSTARLNQITHPFILAAVEEQITAMAQAGHRALLLDAPTLLESGLDRRCDAIIFVSAPHSLRLRRICARDGLSEAEAALRLQAQKADDYYLARADYTIVNDEQAACEEQVRFVLDKLS